jgi:hypothetical protein
MGKAKTRPEQAGMVVQTTLEKIRAKEGGVAVLDELSFEQLLEQLNVEGELMDVAELGEGYHLLQGTAGKDKLVDVPFVIIKYKIQTGWKFGDGVTLQVRTGVPVAIEGRTYNKFIVNDGGSGIARQMFEHNESKDKGKAILCRRGLSRSDYERKDENGDPIIDPVTMKPATGTTFYLNLAN